MEKPMEKPSRFSPGWLQRGCAGNLSGKCLGARGLLVAVGSKWNGWLEAKTYPAWYTFTKNDGKSPCY